MNHPTNKTVYNALSHCIEWRWEKHAASPEGYQLGVPMCKLCQVFLFTSSLGCKACPVYLNNDGKGCRSSQSNFSRWDDSIPGPEKKKRAVIMLEELKAARERFFGDWMK